ncbi:hypothetical protein NUSPORA_01919 [Nucleospora cyclopteri]
MNSQNTTRLKAVLDNSLKPIVKVHGYCRKRVYAEFSIRTIAEYAAAMRCRAFIKYKESPKFIGLLVSSHQRFKSQKKTWCTQTATWLRKAKVDMNVTPEEASQHAAKVVHEKESMKDKSIIGALSNSLGLTNLKRIMKLEICGQAGQMEVRYLIKIRTGIFRYTNFYVLCERLPESMHVTCAICRASVKEDIFHLFLDCGKYTEERKEFLKLDLLT